MKIKGNGRAKFLTTDELRRLFAAFKSERDRTLFAICLFTGCRISEALGLNTTDIQENTITFRKGITKGKLHTRCIPIPNQLRSFLASYHPKKAGPLFPSRNGDKERLDRGSADRILRAACKKVGLRGVSTHSFRRTALTQMSNAGVPLSHIQRVSGHSDLGTLQRYLEVSDEQVRKAVDTIGF